MNKFQSLAFDSRKYSTVDQSFSSKVYSDAALLPNWLLDWLIAGNVNMIEKLVLGGTGTGDLPIINPTR